MSSKKLCCFKNCKKDSNDTTFKFPDDKERFVIWCKNAGVELKGEINLAEPRYLCEKHFTPNYLCHQARRKMLVHTAIPKKWSDFEDFEPNFTLVGSQSARKRKLKDNSFHDTSLHTKYSRTTSSTTQNTRRASNRFSPSTSSEQVEANENDLTEEDFHAREQTKQEAIISLSPQKKFNYIVVKQRSPEAQKNVKVEIKTPPPAKTVILNTFKSPKGLSEDESEVINEEVYFTETLVDADERIHEHAAIPEEKEVTMEGYSEFIFSGEKFVQMPKRVFEAEKEKIKREAEKYKNMLKKLKGQLNKMTDL